MEFFCCLFGKKGWGSVLKAILDLDLLGASSPKALRKTLRQSYTVQLEEVAAAFFLKESSQLMVNWYLEDHHS